MAHATHFLARLERLSQAQTDAALSLYRDTALLKEVLQSYATSLAGDRIALSLDATDAGACLVVTREAGFVTCLAAGMAHDLPLVRWAQVEAAIGRDRRRRELAAIAGGSDVETTATKEFFRELLSGGPSVTREQIAAALALTPVLGPGFLRTALYFAGEARWHHDRARTAADATGRNRSRQRAWESAWAVGHLTLLAFHDPAATFERLDELLGEDVFSPSLETSAMPYLGILGRGTWAAANAGKYALPHYKRLLTTNEALSYDAVLGLAAIARAHARYEAEVRKLFERLAAAPRKLGLAVLDEPDDGGGELETLGAHLALAHTSQLPAGHRLRFASVEEVPTAIACALALNYPISLQSTLANAALPSAVAWVARAKPEDLYLPKEWADVVIPCWSDELGLTLEKLDRRLTPKPEPVVAAKVPGRNEPCVCGSGKKYKKCCGA